MRQRGAIARAFVTDPGMLLMDEPFAALDAQNRIILQAELVRIWEETGKTVVYITHSIDEALLLGDRTVVMTAQPGRVKEIIDIPFRRPRNVMEVSPTAEFGALTLAIWRILEDEVMRARADHLRSAYGGAVADPQGRPDAVVALGLRVWRRVQDRARCHGGVLSGDRQHLCGRRQYRPHLLGRGEELRRQHLRDVHPRRVLRRAAADLCRPPDRARGFFCGAGRRRVRGLQDRYRLFDLERVRH